MNRLLHGRCYTVLVVAMLVAAGCGPAEQIRTYTAPKEVAAPVETNDRMLAAIVPDGERAWFYKVVGPAPVVEAHAEDVIKFVSSIPPAGAAPLPTWTLPEGWSQQPGDGFRLATIKVPVDGKPLDLTVTALPWRETPEELLQNVNRWRGQMSLPPTTANNLDKDARELKLDGRTITIVTLRGRSGGGGMTPPFAGGGANRGSTTRGELPAGHPPVGGGGDQPVARPAVMPTTEAVVAEGDPTFTKPDSWQAVPPSQFRRIGFQIADGPRIAAVSVSDFGAKSAPMISDPLANLNRWRGEVGLPPVAREDMDKTTERIEMDGQPATYVALIPDTALSEQSQLTKATLGAMITVGERIWFFKMSGNRALVSARQDEFKTFLKSVQFPK